MRTAAVNRGRDKEVLARKLGAHDHIGSAADDRAQALQKLGRAEAIIAAVINAEAMQPIVGVRGTDETMMLPGATGPIGVSPIELLMKNVCVRGRYSGVAPDSEDRLRLGELHAVSSMNEVYPFEAAQAACDRIMSGKARFRVVLKMD